MEEDQVAVVALKQHVCKFCSKSFPCGRSLGGHMRSHITNNNNTETEEKLTSSSTRKLSSQVVAEYDLRENPKKTWRIADSRSEGTSLVVTTEDKICKECGKAFHSWKALFGHMKCHSDKERASDQDSSRIVTDSQSDNEEEEATANNHPNRRRRSKRRTRTTSYNMPAASTSSLSFVANHPSNSNSVSEVEQEQEEVAMSLMMLSRDVGHWNAFNFNSLAESSDNNSAYFLSTKTVKLKSKGNKNKKKKKKKKKKSEIPNGLVNNCKEKKKQEELEFQSPMEDSEEDDDSDKLTHNKRGKFKCTTCSKIFHSYQALGGHRASHKKMKGCSGTSRNNESSENTSTETDLINNEEEKKNHHECPICLKVFPSGQALGGHKRSHLGAGSPPVHEIREFLDLNLPASATEEESNVSHGENYRPWWVMEGNSHNHKLGLISN